MANVVIRRLAVAIVATVTATTPFFLGARAYADDASSGASAAFRAGTAAYARGSWREAAAAFEAAFKEAPHGAAAYNAGLAWEAAAEPARAADAYDAALRTGGLERAERADATSRVTRLEGRLGRIDVSAPEGATVSVAQADRVIAPARVHVRPGVYQVVVRFADGETASRTADVARGAIVPVLFQSPVVVEPPVASAQPSPTATPDATHADPSRVPAIGAGPPSGGAPAQRVAGWALLGGGVLTTIPAIVAGVRGLSARDAWDASGRTDEDARDTAVAMRTWANAMWLSAIVLGVAGGVLVLTAPRRGAMQGRSARMTPALPLNP